MRLMASFVGQWIDSVVGLHSMRLQLQLAFKLTYSMRRGGELCNSDTYYQTFLNASLHFETRQLRLYGSQYTLKHHLRHHMAPTQF